MRGFGVSLLAVLLAAGAEGTAAPGPPGQPARVPPGVTVQRDLQYSRAGEKRMLLDLYLPQRADGLLPVIVGIHGGGWMNGSKDGASGVHLVRRGYAVASISYRLSHEAVFPAQIEDCKAAVRWLRAHAGEYGLDPERFGAMGHSAGGHLASLLAVTGDVREFDKGEHLDVSSRIQAACPSAGPSDLARMGGRHDRPDSPEAKLLGVPVQEDRKRAAWASPVTYVTRDDPPFLIIHGDQDATVPVGQARLLHDSLIAAGVESTLHIVEGAGHMLPPGGATAEKVAAFFDKHLKQGAEPPGRSGDADQAPGGNPPSAATPGGVKDFRLDGLRWTCEAEGLPVQGILVKPEGDGPFPAIIVSHGMGSNAVGFALLKAREFVQWGFVVIGPDYTHSQPGVDRSQLGASRENLRRAVACLDILASLPYVDRDRICAYGNSMGAFVTLGVAARVPDRLRAVAITAGGLAAAPGFPAPTPEDAARIRIPTCILHGSADATVPPERSALLKEVLDRTKVPCQRHLFEGVGHNLHRDRPDDTYRLMREWFAKWGVLAG